MLYKVRPTDGPIEEEPETVRKERPTDGPIDAGSSPESTSQNNFSASSLQT